MLVIDCPWCGERNLREFGYGGQARVPFPADPPGRPGEAWGRYLFRGRPQGLVAERWLHAAGCRRWCHLVRDSLTQEILVIFRPSDPDPGDLWSLWGPPEPAGPLPAVPGAVAGEWGPDDGEQFPSG